MNLIAAMIIGAFVIAGQIGALLVASKPDRKPTPSEDWEVRQW